MKLTLEHTETLPHESSRKVVIEIGSDCLSIDQMWDDLIKPALLGMTFAESTVDGFLSGQSPMEDLETYLARQDDSDEPETVAVIDPLMKWQTRDGHPVTDLKYVAENTQPYPLIGYVCGQMECWNSDGRLYSGKEHHRDLIPAKEDAP